MKINKNVLVTGAMGGIGTAIVKKLSDNGYQVFAAIRPNKLAEFECWQVKLDVDNPIIPVEFDLMDKEGTINAISTLLKSYKIGYLVNNAGITRDSTFKKMSPGMWEDVIGCNLLSFILCNTPYFPTNVRRGGWTNN